MRYKIVSLVLTIVICIAIIPIHTSADGLNQISQSQDKDSNPIVIEMIPCSIENTTISYFTDTDAVMVAKVLYNECRGIQSETEKACIVWCILNRVDAGYGTIKEVVTAKHQFAYTYNTPVWDNLLDLSYDVLERWNNEKNGQADIGRVLPSDYFWYSGNKAGTHNYFYNVYNGRVRWNYSLESPYSN